MGGNSRFLPVSIITPLLTLNMRVTVSMKSDVKINSQIEARCDMLAMILVWVYNEQLQSACNPADQPQVSEEIRMMFSQ